MYPLKYSMFEEIKYTWNLKKKKKKSTTVCLGAGEGGGGEEARLKHLFPPLTKTLTIT